MTEPAISVRGISKLYRIGARRDRYRTFRDAIVEATAKAFRRHTPSPEETIWALKDVSFDIQQGEVVGVIGRNGAGKSTLLKILSEITYPTEGRVDIRGRVGSLLEVGTGFHPELTGRENIFLNGAILGMKRAEIRRKFDEIVAFAEIEKFIDTPVKRYSSGMYVRLAFAVAAHLEPEILLVDEVLAVGDIQFQKKCLGKMGDVAKGEGRTILFVSHNMAAVESLCTRALLLNEGQLALVGQTEQVISRFLNMGVHGGYDVDLSSHPARIAAATPVAQRLRITDPGGRTLENISLGEDVQFEIELTSGRPLRDASVGIHIYNTLGQRVVTCHSAYQHPNAITIQGALRLLCLMKRCSLLPGQYSVVLSVANGREIVDRIEPALSFDVVPRDLYATGRLPPSRDGVFAPDVSWEVVPRRGIMKESL